MNKPSMITIRFGSAPIDLWSLIIDRPISATPTKGGSLKLRVFRSLNCKRHQMKALNEFLCALPTSWPGSIGILKEHSLLRDQCLLLIPKFITHEQEI
jgi:hypothetical protein